MRILQLIPETRLGGAESFGFMLSVELARRGHDVLLLATYANGPLFDRMRPTGLKVSAFARRGRLDPGIYRFLAKAIRDFRPDLMHGHNFAANSWVRLLGLRFPKVPVICHEHSGKKTSQMRHRYLLDRLLHRRSTAVFTVSRELYDLLGRRYRVDPSRLHYLPNGIDLDRYAVPVENVRRSDEIVCVANLSRVKNHEGLLRAWKTLLDVHPEAHLTLVGEGGLRESLQRQACAEGIAEHVEFAGRCEDIRPYLWRASAFVLPSHREGMPLSVLEAMAASLPCVVSAVGELPKIIEDGRSGLLVPPGDHERLAEALCSVLRDVDAAGGMGRRAAETVAGRYGLGPCVDAIEKVYRSLLGEAGRVGSMRGEQ